MQQEVLNQDKDNCDLILLSPTGSGKTLAFSLLVSKNLYERTPVIQGLIIVPTRELAIQVYSVLKKVLHDSNVTCVYGGHSTKVERNNLLGHPTVLIGTPGRIIYHLDNNHIELNEVHTCVLDEFDKSLEFGFADQMAYIMNHCSISAKKILTSATQLTEIPDFVKMHDTLTINYLNEQLLKPQLTFKYVHSTTQRKLYALLNLINKLVDQRILIFCNHRDAVDHIFNLLSQRGIEALIFHGGLDQREREIAIIKFKNGSNNILLTTDLAARGLDIPEVNAIIHYQLPQKEESFIHRNGRTARMSAQGTVYLMLTDEEKYSYMPADIQEEMLDRDYPSRPEPEFVTLRINAGKKDKVNKGDVLGYLLSNDKIAKEDIGLIDSRDFDTFVAVKRLIAKQLILNNHSSKIKNKKVKIEIG